MPFIKDFFLNLFGVILKANSIILLEH